MLNSYTRSFLIAALAALSALAQVSNELRFTSVASSGGTPVVISATVAGLGSAMSNGCNYVSLAFADDLADSLWPSSGVPGVQWRIDLRPLSLHRYDASKTYQRFTGAHFYRAVATTNPVAQVDPALYPAFTVGDGSGYSLVTNLPREVALRVYPGTKDGVFVYNDLGAPHWVVWSTNSTRWECGWPWVNHSATNGDTAVFSGIPTQWRVATRAPAPAEAGGFCLIPGEVGVVDPFYIALTETTEATVSALIAYGVSNSLCSAGAYPALPARGADYPVTGYPVGAAVALCNLATRYHNSALGTSFEPVYRVGGAAVYSPVSNAADVAEVRGAAGYRLPTSAEYARASSGDARTPFPWGANASDEYYYATNGLPVTELVLTENDDVVAFYRKYHLVATNSVGNYMSRNGSRHVSPGRVSAVRSQYKSWSVPAINTNGMPVVYNTMIASVALYFGDTVNDAAWGTGNSRVHDLAGNVAELVWPPVVRSWGSVRATVCGGVPNGDASFARSGAASTVNADRGYSTVGFRFARNVK